MTAKRSAKRAKKKAARKRPAAKRAPARKKATSRRTPRGKDGLTQLERDFARIYASEMVSATEAYLRVSAGCTREAAYANASRALSLDKVQEEIARIQEEAAKRSTIAAALRQKYLEDILRAAPAEIDENSPLAQRVKRKTTLLQDGELAEVEITIVSKMEAMKELNRMTGAYAPEKHEVAWPKLTEAITQPAGQLPADD